MRLPLSLAVLIMPLLLAGCSDTPEPDFTITAAAANIADEPCDDRNPSQSVCHLVGIEIRNNDTKQSFETTAKRWFGMTDPETGTEGVFIDGPAKIGPGETEVIVVGFSLNRGPDRLDFVSYYHVDSKTSFGSMVPHY